MNITWNITHLDGGYCCTTYAFPNILRLKNSIRETRKVNFFVRHATKTALDIQVSCPEGDGRDTFAVAHVPPGAERFKYLERQTYSVFDTKPKTRKLFKLTRNQGLPEFKEYLSLVMQDFVPDVEDLTIDLTLYKLPEIKEQNT